MVDPRIAYQIDTGLLRAHLVRESPADMREIRQEFARFLTSPLGRRAETWQEAWNRWTGATPHAAGRIDISTRCRDCSGRGFTHRNAARNLARTGSPMGCANCGGVPGRLVRTTVRATFIPPPQPTPQPTPQPKVNEPTAPQAVGEQDGEQADEQAGGQDGGHA